MKLTERQHTLLRLGLLRLPDSTWLGREVDDLLEVLAGCVDIEVIVEDEARVIEIEDPAHEWDEGLNEEICQ